MIGSRNSSANKTVADVKGTLIIPAANKLSIDVKRWYQHCVKSVRIRSYSGPYFAAFGLNTGRYSARDLAQIKHEYSYL